MRRGGVPGEIHTADLSPVRRAAVLGEAVPKGPNPVFRPPLSPNAVGIPNGQTLCPPVNVNVAVSPLVLDVLVVPRNDVEFGGCVHPAEYTATPF